MRVNLFVLKYSVRDLKVSLYYENLNTIELKIFELTIMNY